MSSPDDPVTPEQAEHHRLVMLYCIGWLDNLREKGLVQGGYELTGKGKEEWQALVESGFKPTDQEQADAVRVLTRRRA